MFVEAWRLVFLRNARQRINIPYRLRVADLLRAVCRSAYDPPFGFFTHFAFFFSLLSEAVCFFAILGRSGPRGEGFIALVMGP
ncbi:hypothetical protein [Caballeronia sp.]|uniref:hypothetical protein n=1 Tax=Caballeronia sp. TaxID=1931223 RepID=UPI003C5844AA